MTVFKPIPRKPIGAVLADIRREKERLGPSFEPPEGLSGGAGQVEEPESYREWVLDNLQIVTEGGDQAPLRYNPIQERLNEVYDAHQAKGGPVHLIVLKARRHGVSTWYQSRMFERVVRMANQTALVLAHDDTASGAI